jgi:2-polyprenyl-3-methyl-5-hydroxy-6-metoxy-1,4-benzoquinol methylase
VDVAALCAGRGEQDAPDAGGEARIGENLLEIVDEMGAAECGDAGEFLRPIVLEKDVVGGQGAVLGAEEALCRHPAARRFVQVDTRRIVVAVAGLVADDKGGDSILGATPQEPDRSGKRHGGADTGAVDMALKALPAELALRQQPDRIAQRALRPEKIGGDEAPLPCRSEEDPVVIDQRVVEIDPDTHSPLRETSCGLTAATYRAMPGFAIDGPAPRRLAGGAGKRLYRGRHPAALRNGSLMSDQIASGKSAAYRDASEALHRAEPSWIRRAAHYRMLALCGYHDLIRNDFHDLFALSADAQGNLLDAGCGAGADTVEFARRAPGLGVHGVDVSSVALGHAIAHAAACGARFHQSSLEQLPFGDAAFDYIASHEVIEHVEDPQVVAREIARVLKPGGVCVVATPNGASLWVDHLRQRAMRACGRRGAPVGADHTRPALFWRRVFATAGLVVERQIYDGAALEFQLFVAPARWMPVLSRLFEPLRVVPLVNLLLCDRVKFRLCKPGIGATAASGAVAPCCPVCHTALEEAAGGIVVCIGGSHRFARSADTIVNFTVMAPEPAPPAAEPSIGQVPPAAPGAPPGRPEWLRRLRRGALLALSVFYAGFLLLLAPLGFAVGRFYQPFGPRSSH